MQTLHVEIEEVGARHWWAALLATLFAQYGNAYLRFVGVVGNEPRYVGPTFPVPRGWGSIPPQESWAPGMTDALAEVRQKIVADGWREVGHGSQPWNLTFELQPTGGSTSPTVPIAQHLSHCPNLPGGRRGARGVRAVLDRIETADIRRASVPRRRRRGRPIG